MKTFYLLLMCIFLTSCSANTYINDPGNEFLYRESPKGTFTMKNPYSFDYYINKKNWSISPIENANPKVVLLTIDDAPDKYTLEMAKTLKSLHVNAIFFVNGIFINKGSGKDVLKEIHEMGFVIGNHTMDHTNLKSQTEEEQRDAILELNELIESITGEKPIYFRPPFGSFTEYSKDYLTKENMSYMNWTYGYDFVKEYMTKDALVEITLNAKELRNGANLLFHDRQWTNDALREIVEGLRAKGYEFVDPKTIDPYYQPSK